MPRNPMMQHQIQRNTTPFRQAAQNAMRPNAMQGPMQSNNMQNPMQRNAVQHPSGQNPMQQNAVNDPNITFEPLQTPMHGFAPTPQNVPMQSTMPQNMPTQNAMPQNMSVQNPALAAKLAALAQDERNGAAFYLAMAGIASSEWDRNLLEELSENSRARSTTAAGLARDCGDMSETTASTAVPPNLRYGDGVALAVRQESRTIDNLALLLAQTEDPFRAHAVNALLARKMSDFGKLLLLR